MLGPDGTPVSETLRGGEGILYADIDVGMCVEPKQFHDIVGYYNRFDIFKLTIDRTPRSPVNFDGPAFGLPEVSTGTASVSEPQTQLRALHSGTL